MAENVLATGRLEDGENPDYRPREPRWWRVQIVAAEGSELFTELDEWGYLVVHVKSPGASWAHGEPTPDQTVTHMEPSAVCFDIESFGNKLPDTPEVPHG